MTFKTPTTPKASTSLKTLYSIALALALVIGLAACGSKASEGHDAAALDTESPAAKAGTPEVPEAETPEAEVTFEPAYPEEVSEEGLSETDTDQQKEEHSHGDGAPHTHGEEGDHSHG